VSLREGLWIYFKRYTLIYYGTVLRINSIVARLLVKGDVLYTYSRVNQLAQVRVFAASTRLFPFNHI
jgi:hypothetical protein